MTVLTVGREASAGVAHAVSYARHRPEQTLLYQLVQIHYPAFLVELAARERHLPDYVQREFEDYLACGCFCCWRLVLFGLDTVCPLLS